MKTTATVIARNADGTVTVEVTRASACEGCHKKEAGGCSVCALLGGDRRMRARARDPIGVSPGDRVEIESDTRRTLFYAALVFLLPLLLFFAGFGTARLCGAGEGFSFLFGLVGFFLAFAGVAVYSRAVIAKRTESVIVARLECAEPEQAKGPDADASSKE